MTAKQLIILGATVIATCIFRAARYGYSEPADERVVRLAELEIYPDQLENYKAALKEEIETSIRAEPGC